MTRATPLSLPPSANRVRMLLVGMTLMLLAAIGQTAWAQPAPRPAMAGCRSFRGPPRSSSG